MPIFQVTISGTDPGGFVWENVFHVSGQLSTGKTVFGTAGDLAAFVAANVVPTQVDAMHVLSKVLAVSVRGVGADASFTNTKPVPTAGTRMGDASIGGVCGRIGFIPSDPPLVISSWFQCCGLLTDYLNDVITGPYEGLLHDLAVALEGMNGSEPINIWQFCQYHKKSDTSTPIVDDFVSPNPTLMNKRIRA